MSFLFSAKRLFKLPVQFLDVVCLYVCSGRSCSGPEVPESPNGSERVIFRSVLLCAWSAVRSPGVPLSRAPKVLWVCSGPAFDLPGSGLCVGCERRAPIPCFPCGELVGPGLGSRGFSALMCWQGWPHHVPRPWVRVLFQPARPAPGTRPGALAGLPVWEDGPLSLLLPGPRDLP